MDDNKINKYLSRFQEIREQAKEEVMQEEDTDDYHDEDSFQNDHDAVDDIGMFASDNNPYHFACT